MLVQPDLCQTCSETTLLVFPRGGSFTVSDATNKVHLRDLITVILRDIDSYQTEIARRVDLQRPIDHSPL